MFGIIILLPKELGITFLTSWVCQQWILLAFPFLKILYFSFLLKTYFHWVYDLGLTALSLSTWTMSLPSGLLYPGEKAATILIFTLLDVLCLLSAFFYDYCFLFGLQQLECDCFWERVLCAYVCVFILIEILKYFNWSFS